MQQALATKNTIIHIFGDDMILKLINHNEEYAVREITASFFPKTKFEYSDNTEDGDYIASEYLLSKNKHIYKASAKIGELYKEYEFSAKEYNKTHIKRCVARVLEELTGIHLPWGVLTGIRPSKIIRELKLGGKNTDEAKEYLKSFYETDSDKAALATEVALNEEKHIENMDKKGISLYIGIPFCPTRCLYCSFTSQSIDFSNKLTVPYIEALKKEIKAIGNNPFVKNRKIETIYFGGGTPSALSANQIDEILYELFNSFDLKDVKEITFEAGRPDTITKEKLEILKKYGISRISINPQTAKDETLELIGRKHTSEDFLKSFKLARQMGFNHINCDIIAGLPQEDAEDFENTIKLLSKIEPESITVHTMCIKHGSFLDMKYDMYSMTAANTVNKMLSIAGEYMKKEDYIPYYMYRQKNMLGNLENIGYCKKGHECLYNIYIMEEVQSIIALGAGGSTKLVAGDRIERVFNVKEVSEYIKRIDEMIERKETIMKEF